jgi:hypothetical protein
MLITIPKTPIDPNAPFVIGFREPGNPCPFKQSTFGWQDWKRGQELATKRDNYQPKPPRPS